MAVKKNQQALIKKLKKQVRTLETKKNQSQNQRRAALKKIGKISRSFKAKLLQKSKQLKSKLAEVRALAYAKASTDFQSQLMKGVDGKARTLSALAARLEKKRIAKLAKNIAKKGKKKSKVKKAGTQSVMKSRKIRRSRKNSHSKRRRR
ncbi:MAG: hypothetical protein A3F12_06775 [Gammaproteobacteria bacterium RIFCSPHIGHO2_12_FULL_38_14]|nr:MAG: hypothetical protein A3F12_06775 [Gammaproteobacteria bacterium RIFCSPHIGHO2_12_FULL_38_14]